MSTPRLAAPVRILIALVAPALIVGAASSQGPPAGFIPAGIDCLETSCGRSQSSFCENPIPPDFFEPGSQPFSGVVRLGGPQGGLTDTQVRRLNDMALPSPGSEATIPIELIQLNLVSCAPIIVTVGASSVQWDVRVDLSVVQPPPGHMTVRKTHANGGTFESTFHVQPRFTFTRADDPAQVRVLDTGLVGMPPDTLVSLGEAPWVHQCHPNITPSPCGVNFVPGVQKSLKGRDVGTQCCVLTCHAGATTTHCIVIDRDCSGCPEGACCTSRGRCAASRASRSQTPEQRCTSRGGTYAGNGTTCGDFDGDGIPDVLENNDCCGTRDDCHSGTNPLLADTDGDGADDGLELKAGTNPCDAGSVP